MSEKPSCARLLVLFSAIVVLSRGAALGDDFFAERAKVFKLYGDCSPSDVARMYERNRREYRDRGYDYFLYRTAALAELLGDDEAREKALIEALEVNRYGADFITYCVEVFRSCGTLRDNVSAILTEAEGLSAGERFAVAKALAGALRWTNPPEEVVSFAREALGECESPNDFTHFAWAFASWGERREAVGIVERAFAASDDSDVRLDYIKMLRRMGALDEAAALSMRFVDEARPVRASRSPAPIDIYRVTLRSMSGRVGAALSGGTLSYLLDRNASAPGAGTLRRALERAAIFDAAAMYAEEADVLADAEVLDPTGDVRVLRAGVLSDAGDDYSAARMLLASAAGSGAAGEDAGYDLLDSLIAINDSAALEAIAVAYSLMGPEAQEARMMSQWLRVIGNMDAADKLFDAFIEGSGMGDDGRFAWHGKRLRALYLLDTSRIAEAKSEAFGALEASLEQEHLLGSLRSTLPEQFVEMFARFDGVEELYRYCRGREEALGGAVLVKRIERAALSALGRWDEALKLDADINSERDEVNRDLFAAAANAEAGRWQEAAVLYQRAIDAGGVPPEAYEALANAYAALEMWDKAEKTIEAAPADGNEIDRTVRSALFMASFGRAEDALRIFSRLENLSTPVDADNLGKAVRFWVGNGEAARAAAALSSRIALCRDYSDKVEYVKHATPVDHAGAVGFFVLMREMEASRIASDSRILALFYRGLGGIFEETLDPANALAAYMAAARLDEADPQNHLAVLSVSSGWKAAIARDAAEKYLARITDPGVLMELARADATLAEAERAKEAIVSLADGPLRLVDSARLVDVVEEIPQAAGVFLQSANVESWPWTLRSRLVDAAGRDAEAVRAIVGEGGFVGRALWAARTLAAGGRDEPADAVLTDFAQKTNHPAAYLAAADLELRRGLPDDARGALDAARASTSQRPVLLLVEGEIERLGAP
jgi:tetratricopeptide (TPR) repeat protein